MISYAFMFLASAALSFLLAYPIRSAALHFGVVDHPERRKMHQIPIPLMGGLAIFLSFAVTSSLAYLAPGALEISHLRAYLGLMAGAVLVLALGIYDDVRGLKAPVKFAGQTLAALVVVAMGARVDLFTNPLGGAFEIGWLGIPVTIFWIVGVTNAVNLIDGLDGLAVGIGSIAAIGLFFVAAPGNAFLAGLSITLAGAGIGFLRHNFYPARIFLGDSGSMFIGFTLAVISLQGSYKASTATVLFLPIIVLGVPIFDTLFAIFRRARRRVNPFKADREHIHHRLVRIGLHHRSVVLMLYFVCIYLVLTAYSIARLPHQTAFLFLVLLVMGGIMGLRTLQFVEERLEAGAVAAQGQADVTATLPAAPWGGRRARNGGSQGGPGRGMPAFGTLMCEISGLRESFGAPAEIEAMCAEIRNMLSRRVNVHAVVAEPTAPGHLILLLRTMPLKPEMTAMVRDGLTWYLSEHHHGLSSDPGFPRIRWIGTGPLAEDSGGAGSGSARAGAPSGSENDEVIPMPLREGRAGVGS